MIIQLLVCFLAFVFLMVFKNQEAVTNGPSNIIKTRYIIVMSLILILQSGLRNVAVGVDTFAYYNLYNESQDYDWQYIGDKFESTYINGEGKDPGYYVFLKLTNYFIPNYQIYLLFIAVIFFTSLGFTLNKFCKTSNNVFIGILVYEVLFYGFFSITGIRQTLAVAILLFSLKFIYERKLIPFIILGLVASTLHKSALIFLPFYFIANFKKPILLLSICFISLPLIFLVSHRFALFLTSFSFSESYANFTEPHYVERGAPVFLLFMIVFTILILIDGKKLYVGKRYNIMSINAFSLALFFTPLAWVDPSLMRVVMYFSIFSIFLLGDCIDILADKLKIGIPIFYVIIFFTFALTIYTRHSEYAFFWEEMALPWVYY